MPIKHVPALDGLRGLALMGVLSFHANETLAGGFLGVDLFFVLSGFLITSLLVAEHDATGRIDFAAFWNRRARRLFPALFALLAGVAIYCAWLADGSELHRIRGDAIATLGYFANWRAVYTEKSYWEMFATPSPLDHTWSLSIEEQFYVVWPLVAALFLRRGRRALLVASAVLAVASMTAMFVFSRAEISTRAYMGTDTRATAIVAGAMLALWRAPDEWARISSAWVLDVIGVASAIALAVAWSVIDGDSPMLYRGGFWLTEVCALVLVVCAVAGERSSVGRALAFRPLAWLGTVSYGAYLWHWPVDVVLNERRVHVHGLPLYALQVAVTLGVAAASYRWLELPIRARGLPVGKPFIVVPVAVGALVLALVASTRARGVVRRETPPAIASASFRVMVLGDSTALSLGEALVALHEPDVAFDLRGEPGCALLRDGCGSLSWATWIADQKPNVAIVYLGGAFLLHGSSYRPDCGEWNDRLRDRLTTRLVGLGNASTRTWLVTVPHPVGLYDTAPIREVVECINESIRAAAKTDGLGVIDLAEHLCPKGACERERGGVPIRVDGVHFAVAGAEDVARWVLSQLR